MVINELFSIVLDKISSEKRDLLHHINNQRGPHFSINQLSIELNMNYKKAAQLVLELEEDFLALGWGSLVPEKGIVIWKKDNSKETAYLRFLVQKSLGYQILKAILLTPEKTLPQFCQEHFISQSTLLRRIRPLSLYLKKYDVWLNAGQMTITSSDEENVQAVFFKLLGVGAFGADLFAADISLEEELRVLDKLAHQGATLLNEWVGLSCLLIARLRLKNHHPLPKPSCPPPLFLAKAKILEDYFANFSCDAAEIENAACSLYFKLFTNHYLSENDWRIKKVTQQFTDFLARGIPTATISQDFIVKLQKDYFYQPLTQSEATVLQCNIFLIFYLLESPALLAATRLQTMLPTVVTQKDNYQELVTFCQLFLCEYEYYLEKTLLSAQQVKDLPYFLAESVYPYVEKKHYQIELFVGIQPLPNYYMMTSLTNFLNQIKFVSYEIYQENTNYDFYIGVTKDHFTADKEIYLLALQHHAYQGELFQHLLDALQKKAQNPFSFAPTTLKKQSSLSLT